MVSGSGYSILFIPSQAGGGGSGRGTEAWPDSLLPPSVHLQLHGAKYLYLATWVTGTIEVSHVRGIAFWSLVTLGSSFIPREVRSHAGSCFHPHPHPCPSPRISLCCSLESLQSGPGELACFPWSLPSFIPCLPKSSAHPILSPVLPEPFFCPSSPLALDWRLTPSTAYQTLPAPLPWENLTQLPSVCLPIPSQTSPKGPLPQLQSGCEGATGQRLCCLYFLSHSLSTAGLPAPTAPLPKSTGPSQLLTVAPNSLGLFSLNLPWEPLALLDPFFLPETLLTSRTPLWFSPASLAALQNLLTCHSSPLDSALAW